MPHRPIRDLIEHRRLVSASETTTVAEAARMMKDANVGALLVMRGEALAGIFTERDALTRVLAAGLDPLRTQLSGVMTPDPQTLDAAESFGRALVMMHERGYRHVPVTLEGRPVGVVSMRDALPPELDDLARERERISEILR